MPFQILIPPLVGAVIGYSTNYLAIKMLFRPLRPVMIGRFRVPFTPGIVPRHKNRLADILGGAVVDQFFNADDLEIVFTSDVFGNAVADRVCAHLDDPDTKLRFLRGEAAERDAPLQKLKDELCIRIQAAVLKSDLKNLISDQGGQIIRERFTGSVVEKLLNENTISQVAGPLAEQIEKYVLENGRSFILPMIDAELDDLSREPVVNIADEILPDKAARHALIRNIYALFMKTHVRPIVESIDVGGMITEKVRQMDALDIERLVLTVVKRELHFVVLLGGFLGALIGTVLIFI
jgi:uncharacterized membrane protein YheB (UPF0754 family)